MYSAAYGTVHYKEPLKSFDIKQYSYILLGAPVGVFHTVNPQSTELFNLNSQSLEVVSRYRDTQLQVTENVCDLSNLSPNIYQCFKIEGIFYF